MSFKTDLKKQLLAQLRIAGLETLELDGPPRFLDKPAIRRMHIAQRKERSDDLLRGFRSSIRSLIGCFAEGNELHPKLIRPKLIRVLSDTKEAELFRFASMLWAVPVSPGYGRRMRYLVWDMHTDKLMGLLALGDPVFNLKSRDNWIGWDLKEKTNNLCHVMDAYVLGAVPPYSQILCGKLIAALTCSQEIRDDFKNKYRRSVGLISKKKKKPTLALITTTSALGRSSIYNRLKFKDRPLFLRIGETEGWGHFHLSSKLFQKMRAFLRIAHHAYADNHKFGNGPNWKLRALRTTLAYLGIPQGSLKHGVKREVYAIPMGRNTKEFLKNENKTLKGYPISSKEISDFYISRWVFPRSQRDNRYKQITREMILRWILGQSAPDKDIPPFHNLVQEPEISKELVIHGASQF